MSSRQEKKARRLAAQTTSKSSTPFLKKKKNFIGSIVGLPSCLKILVPIFLLIALFLSEKYIYKNYLGTTVRFWYVNLFPHHNDSTGLNSFSLAIKGVLRQREKTDLKIQDVEATLYNKNGEVIPSKIEDIPYDTLLINTLNANRVVLRNLKESDIRLQTVHGTIEDTCFLFLRVQMNMFEFIDDSDYKIKLRLVDDKEMVHRLSFILSTVDSEILDKKRLQNYGLDTK